MCVQNWVPIGPQATTCIPSEGYTHTHTHTLLYRYRCSLTSYCIVRPFTVHNVFPCFYGPNKVIIIIIIVGPSITVFDMPRKRRRMLFNTNHNSISGTSKCHNVHNEEDTLRKTSPTKYPVALSQNRLISYQGHSFLYHY